MILSAGNRRLSSSSNTTTATHFKYRRMCHLRRRQQQHRYEVMCTPSSSSFGVNFIRLKFSRQCKQKWRMIRRFEEV